MEDTKLGSDAIDAIAELKAKSIRPEIIKATAEPDDVYYIAKPDGSFEKVTAEPKPLKDQLANPSELASYIRDLSLRDGMPQPSEGIVKVQPSGVYFGFEFEDRRHQAHVPLKETHSWQAIKRLVGDNYSGVLMTQADVYRLLRVTLRGCLPDGTSLPQIIREVKWNADGQVTGTIEQGKRTLGADIIAKVAGSGGASIPPEFTVTLNVYENFVHPISVAIDLDTIPTENKFRLTPYPGEIERKLDDTLRRIREVFDSSAVDNDAKPICPAYVSA